MVGRSLRMSSSFDSLVLSASNPAILATDYFLRIEVRRRPSRGLARLVASSAIVSLCAPPGHATGHDQNTDSHQCGNNYFHIEPSFC